MKRWAGRWAAAVDQVRRSLFFLPLVAVVSAGIAARVLVSVEGRAATDWEIPFVFTSTVDSARALLSTIAAATISFAGIAFSVSMLVLQRTSSQYSPRVVDTLFRDPFNRRVMAIVVGTFTYSLLVLRSVRDLGASDSLASVPDVAVSVALAMGILAILAIVAFIDHSARAMDVSQILEQVSQEAVRQLGPVDDHSSEAPSTVAESERLALEDADLVVTFAKSGWVQSVDIDALCGAAPAGGVIELATAPGRYAIAGAPLCALAGAVDDEGATVRRCRDAIGLGPTRTLQQDSSYGIRQTVDIALRALSPGVNDPTTAQDAIFHVAGLLVEVLRRPAADQVVETGNGGRVLLAQLPRPADLVSLAYEEIRIAAADQPTVCIYLLESIEQVEAALACAEIDPPASLREQAALVVAGSDAVPMLDADHRRVREAHERRFGS